MNNMSIKKNIYRKIKITKMKQHRILYLEVVKIFQDILKIVHSNKKIYI